jgi:hypothetical protein
MQNEDLENMLGRVQEVDLDRFGDRDGDELDCCLALL